MKLYCKRVGNKIAVDNLEIIPISSFCGQVLKEVILSYESFIGKLNEIEGFYRVKVSYFDGLCGSIIEDYVYLLKYNDENAIVSFSYVAMKKLMGWTYDMSVMTIDVLAKDCTR